jgi:lysozyme family protein
MEADDLPWGSRNFEAAYEVLVEKEGGFADRATDPGGETWYGISLRYWPGVDVERLKKEPRYRKKFFYDNFWAPMGLIRIDDGVEQARLATQALLFGVHTGQYRGQLVLQQAYNMVRYGWMDGLLEDGALGPVTARWVNRFLRTEEAQTLTAAYKIHAGMYYNQRVHEDDWVRGDIRGWINRLDAA